MYDPFDKQEPVTPSTPDYNQPPSAPPPTAYDNTAPYAAPNYSTPQYQTEEPVKSYTATPYDRYTAENSNPNYQYFTPTSPKVKPKKTVSLTTAILCSTAVSVVSSVLVVLIMVFGLGLGSMLQGSPGKSSSQSKNNTKIVVDSSADTIAEAVATKASPSVVGVVVTSSVNYFFFGSSETASEGSGIIYSDDGYIITNYHVVQSAVENEGKVAIYLAEDTATAIDAQVIGYDISSDLAVLKVAKTGLTPIELGDSDTVKVGQIAIAIGNPGGMKFMGSVSEGIISGLDRPLQLENSNTEINLIQTDASINPGNSGGALVNSQGQLIGINSAKMASDNFEGMGFAIPVNDAVSIVERIIKNIDAPQPYIGIEISTYYDADTLKLLGYPAGVVVSNVVEGSPAAQSGLKRNDIITHFNGNAVGSYTQFNSEKSKCAPGETVTLTVFRSDRTFDVSVVLGAANS